MTTMARYNIAQAKARFSELVSKALSGEEVVVSRDNTPLLKLVPLGAPSTPRKPGSARGQVTMTPDFDQTPTGFEDYV